MLKILGCSSHRYLRLIRILLLGLTIFGIRGTFTGWVDSSIVNYTITQSTGTYHLEWYEPSSDSSTSYWSHRYITATKTITGWNKIIATLTNYDFGSTRWYNMIWVYVKVINDGLAWYPGPYPNHGTWNYWRSCWIWKDGTVQLHTLSRDMRDHQNPANNEVEVVWTREADAGTFTNNVFVKKLIYGNYNSSTKYWAIGTIVSVYVTDNSGTASAMCKLNSFNSWFSKS